MKAIVLTRYGPPDALELQDVERPTPKAGEVLVRVRATSINDWDWSFMRGKPWLYRLLFGVRAPKVKILGAEVAGLVESLGDGVTRFAPGDAVYGDISEAGFGAFAEYVCVSEDALARKPEALSFREAAAIPHAAGLAMQGLLGKGELKRGQNVLINGAGGGVGTLGLQIAKLFDAEVTGVDSADKLAMMESMGFDHVVDYGAQDFTAGDERYDLVLDTKTTHSPFRHARCLKSGGRYVTVGGALPRLLQTFLLAPLVSRLTGKSVHIVALRPNQDLEVFCDRFEAGKPRVVIDGPYSLSDIPRAMALFGRGEHKGKVVIDLDNR